MRFQPCDDALELFGQPLGETISAGSVATCTFIGNLRLPLLLVQQRPPLRSSELQL
jgi:hypothetical protein